MGFQQKEEAGVRARAACEDLEGHEAALTRCEGSSMNWAVIIIQTDLDVQSNQILDRIKLNATHIDTIVYRSWRCIKGRCIDAGVVSRGGVSRLTLYQGAVYRG